MTLFKIKIVCVCACVHVCLPLCYALYVFRCPQRTWKVLDPHKLVIQRVVPHLTWVLWTETRSTIRAASPFNYWAISPSPFYDFIILFLFIKNNLSMFGMFVISGFSLLIVVKWMLLGILCLHPIFSTTVVYVGLQIPDTKRCTLQSQVKTWSLKLEILSVASEQRLSFYLFSLGPIKPDF